MMVRSWYALVSAVVSAMVLSVGCGEAEAPPAQPTPAATAPTEQSPPTVEPAAEPAPDPRLTYAAFRDLFVAAGRPARPDGWAPTPGAQVLACDTPLEHWVSYSVTRVEGNNVWVHDDRANVDLGAPFQIGRVAPMPDANGELPAVGSFVLTPPEPDSTLWCPARVTSVDGDNVAVELIHCQRGTDPQDFMRRTVRRGELALIR